MIGIITPPNDGDVLQAKGGYFKSVSSAVFTATLTIAGVAYLAVTNVFTMPQTISPLTTAVNTLLFLQSSIANFLQVDIQNTSTAPGAQSGFSSTADIGSATTWFNWFGINNSGPALSAQWNIGGPLDSAALSFANDLYLANANPAKDIILCTGTGNASTAQPYFQERMRLSQNSGVRITGPIFTAPIGQLPGGMIGVVNFGQFAAPARATQTLSSFLF